MALSVRRWKNNSKPNALQARRGTGSTPVQKDCRSHSSTTRSAKRAPPAAPAINWTTPRLSRAGNVVTEPDQRVRRSQRDRHAALAAIDSERREPGGTKC